MRLRRLPILIGLIFVAVALALGFYAQRAAALPFVWTQMPMNLPPSIKVYLGTSSYGGPSVRAWHLDIDYNDKTLRAQPWLSTDPTGRETGSVMAKQAGAVVAINGGYFDMQSVPARTFSLVMRNGKILVPNVAVVKRPTLGHEYPVTRSAFGIRADRSFDVAWVAQQGNVLWMYPRPTAHTMTTVAPGPTREFPPGGHAWDAVDAIGGGPTLVSDGVIQNTYENEVFFGSGFPNDQVYPRAAIGYTKDKHLILFTTDGEQRLFNAGLTLAELAQEMQRLGCVEAMNLDGGGSETLVVNGQAINHPSDGQERAITSILAITQNPPATPQVNAAPPAVAEK